MRELRIGDRVRTPQGVGEVTGRARNAELRPAWRVRDADGREAWWDASNLCALADIPRERVEALHAAVTARLEQLEASRAATWYASEKDIFAACHSDLSKVAEALRLLLEVDP